MPTPLEILLDPVSLAVLSIYALLMIWEAIFPARQLPKIKYWKLRGLSAFAFFFYLSSYLPILTDPYLEPFRLVDLSSLGALGGGLVGILLYEFGVYVWHRALHTSDFLWRTFHQMHHSAERLDTYGAFYFSPMDMIGWTVLGSICFALLVGLSPQAITVTLLVTNFMGMFQHANINTPRWLGYIIQRPESHTVHHAKGIHKHNYSDLPIFDILFGTFENPRKYEHQTGFYYGASAKVLDMLTFKDLNKEKAKNNTKRNAKKQATKALGLLLVLSLTINCSKDVERVIQDPIQENPDLGQNPEASITSITPGSGTKETLVIIEGKNFGSDLDSIQLSFNGLNTEIKTLSENRISALVPKGAGTGFVKLVIDGMDVLGPSFNYITTGLVTTFAGSMEGHKDGTSGEAQFNSPTGIAVDKHGNIYVGDTFNHKIRKIAADGTVITIAGTKAGDVDGVIPQAKFNFPRGIAVDDVGTIYVADFQNHKIKKITNIGVVVTIAGSTEGFEDGQGGNAKFAYPEDVALDSDGNIYVADGYNNRIRKITPDGIVSTLAGGDEGYADGSAFEAKFYYPSGVVLDSYGNVYVADENNHKIRKVTPDGMVSTLAGSTKGYADGPGNEAKFFDPSRLACDTGGNIYVSDLYNNRIRKISPGGLVSTLAGSDKGYADGTGAEVQFDGLAGIVFNPHDDIYVVDRGNHKIRKVTQE